MTMTTFLAPDQPTKNFGKNVRRVREEMNLTIDEFAALIRKAGQDLGDPNGCTKRLVQKWEAGDHSNCRPNYRRAIGEAVGIPYTRMCEEWPEPMHLPEPMYPPAPSASGVADAATVIDSVMAQLTALRMQLGADHQP
jgi:hypothetical protein